MNQLIKNELDKVNVALIPAYNEDTLTLLIPKGSREVDKIKFEKGKYYTIEIADRLLRSDDELLNLHIQWNNGIVPKDKYMNIEVIDIMGNMVKVTGTGHGTINAWTGWLPINSVEICKLLV